MFSIFRIWRAENCSSQMQKTGKVHVENDSWRTPRRGRISLPPVLNTNCGPPIIILENVLYADKAFRIWKWLLISYLVSRSRWSIRKITFPFLGKCYNLHCILSVIISEYDVSSFSLTDVSAKPMLSVLGYCLWILCVDWFYISSTWHPEKFINIVKHLN
jgi:hypothetical protein